MTKRLHQFRLYTLGMLFLFALALLACGAGNTATETPEPQTPSEAPPAEAQATKIGVRYVHSLYTHCGIRSADFDGRRWLADPVLTSNEGLSPPPGWGNPTDPGTMELVTEDRAMFISGSGERAFFVPAPEDHEFMLCF